MAIQSVAIGATNTTIFTATGDKMVATIIFCNQELPNPLQLDSNTTYLDVHLVANGDSADTTNRIVNGLMIPAGETVFFDTERIVLQDGDSVVALTSSPAVITATISTVDI
jgi:hypothetical protein